MTELWRGEAHRRSGAEDRAIMRSRMTPEYPPPGWEFSPAGPFFRPARTKAEPSVIDSEP